MSSSLKDLITQIRACKTAAEERALVAKECAAVRESFKNSEASRRDRNVAKLMFIQMMGYSTTFGQMECFKLISSNDYSEKRIGYLALSQLMDETSEVLMLGTQTIKNDIEKKENNLCSSLALTALANVANEEMCLAVANDLIDRLNSGSYIRRRVACVMLRCIRKCPQLLETFLPHVRSLIEDRSHGVALAGLNLSFYMMELDANVIQEMKACVPNATRRLKELCMSGTGSNGDYDIYSITDPFLQTKLIRFLRIVCAEDKELTESISDTLVQLATNTDGTRNTGNAILLEVASCFAGLKHADPSMVVMASTILGKFLANARDPNLRLVGMDALKTLLITGNLTPEALAEIQKKRPLVFQCLKESDPAVRSCALEVACLLINVNNAKASIRELLNFLLDAEESFKPMLVSRIWKATIGFSSDVKWIVDTLVKVMCLAGNSCSEDDVDVLLSLIISSSPENQAYAVFRLFFAVKENLNQKALVHAAIWSVGELADLLISAQAQAASGQSVSVTASDVTGLLNSIEERWLVEDVSIPKTHSSLISNIHQVGEQTDCTLDAEVLIFKEISSFLRARLFIVNAWAKLAVRLPGSEQVCLTHLKKYADDCHIEVQQRAVELSTLLSGSACSGKAKELLDRTPPVAACLLENRKKLALCETGCLSTNGQHSGGAKAISGVAGVKATGSAGVDAAKAKKNFFESDDEEEKPANTFGSTTSAKPAAVNTFANNDMHKKVADLLDVFGGATSNPPTSNKVNPMDNISLLTVQSTAPATTTTTNAPASSSLLDLFGVPSTSTTPALTTNMNVLANSQTSPSNDLLNIFGMGGNSLPSVPTPSTTNNAMNLIMNDVFVTAPSSDAYAPFEVYNKNGLKVTFMPQAPSEGGAALLKDGGEVKVKADMSNSDPSAGISGLNLEIAPPKYLSVKLETASSSQLTSNGGRATQMITIRRLAEYQGSITVKCRISYTKAGQFIQELTSATGFSPNL